MNLWGRRRFLHRTLMGFVVLLWHCLGCKGGQEESKERESRKLAVFDRMKSHSHPGLERVGESYLQQFRAEGNQIILIKHLELPPSFPDSLKSVDLEVPALAKHLGLRIRQDFQADRVWEHQGWILSRTEGRIAALRHMRRPASAS